MCEKGKLHRERSVLSVIGQPRLGNFSPRLGHRCRGSFASQSIALGSGKASGGAARRARTAGTSARCGPGRKPLITVEFAHNLDHLVDRPQIAIAHGAVGDEHRLAQAAICSFMNSCGVSMTRLARTAALRSRAHFTDIPSLAAISSMVAPAANFSISLRSRCASARSSRAGACSHVQPAFSLPLFLFYHNQLSGRWTRP
jgi:hypothetical protein